ncbi:MAG: hypothetical protein EOP60_08205 [Sphingomonadales bacterium]|nr:MAG: hypothetical protein EOP60_08205 [Sphingomonadales bacterium]
MIEAVARRLILPSALSGLAAHLLILSIFTGEPVLRINPAAVVVLALIVLTGLVAAGVPLFRFLRSRQIHGVPAGASMLIVGTLTGAVLMMLFFGARALTDISFGLAVGALASLIWLAINFDLVRTPSGDTSG